MDIAVRPGLVIPDAELTAKFTPSGGPGGQHANKANTRVELSWDIESSEVVDGSTRDRLIEKFGPVLRVVVDDERSQTRNRELAHERMRARIQSALHRPKARRPTRPSRSSQRRRIQGKRQRGMLKKQRRRPGRDD